MRPSCMGPGTYADPWHSGHAFSASSCRLFQVLCTVLPSLEWLPAVPVRPFDEERTCSRSWLGRWLVVCDHRADVIGRSKVTVEIAVHSVHGPVSNQLCRIHPQLRPRRARRFSSPCVPACPSHVIPLTGQCISLERAFSADCSAACVRSVRPSSSSIYIAQYGSSPQKGHARGGRLQSDCAGRGPDAVGSPDLEGRGGDIAAAIPSSCVRPHHTRGCG